MAINTINHRSSNRQKHPKFISKKSDLAGPATIISEQLSQKTVVSPKIVKIKNMVRNRSKKFGFQPEFACK